MRVSPDSDGNRIPSVIVDTNGCWIWTRSHTPQGYGVVSVPDKTHKKGHRTIGAHRYFFEAFNGPIPPDLETDHLCRVRLCVNPAHMELVTHRENTLRGDTFPARQAARTACPKGHPYSGENLIRRGNRRGCRICTRIRQKQYMARRSANG